MPKLRRTRSLVVPPLRLPIDHHFLAAQARHAAGHGLVVAKGAIPVNLAEIRKDSLDQFHGVRALGMPCPLDSFPRRRNALHMGTCFSLLFAHQCAARFWAVAPALLTILQGKPVATNPG